MDNSVQNALAEPTSPPKRSTYSTLHHFRAHVESIEMFGEHLRVKKVLCDGSEEFKSSVLGISPCGNQGCPDVGSGLGPEVGASCNGDCSNGKLWLNSVGQATVLSRLNKPGSARFS